MVSKKNAAVPPSLDASGVRSVRRALEIMSLLRREHPVVTLREVVEGTGLPRTTAIRLIDTLEDCGLLWSIDTNAYAAGPALLRWNGLAAELWRLPLSVQRAMEALAQRSRETATLFVRQGTQRICIGQVQGTQALRQVTRVGGENPLWAGAPAKVLLVGLDDVVLQKIAEASPHGSRHLKQLRAWQSEAQSAGYAVSHGEREDGLSVVSVPVHSESGATVAALAVAGPRGRFGERAIEQLLVALRSAAAEMHGQPVFAFSSALPTIDDTARPDDSKVPDGAEVAGDNR